jgi:hypothetical protein
MEHWDAWCNLGGSLLGALGGLYLTYDLLGGKDGPLAGVTRVVTYMFLYGITFCLGLGLKFGLVAGFGMGVILGFDYYREARRIHTKSKPPHWSSMVLLALARALILALALWTITNGPVAGWFFLFNGLFLIGTYFLGWSTTKERELSDKLVVFRPASFGLAVARGIGAGLSFWFSLYLVSGTPIPAFSFASPWRVGLTIWISSFFITCFTPWVEWRMEHMSKRVMSVVGLSFAIVGFLIQALPNWLVLLQ